MGHMACFQPEQLFAAPIPLFWCPDPPRLLCYLQQTPRDSLSRHQTQRHHSSCWQSRSSGPPESLSCCCPVEDRERGRHLSSRAGSRVTHPHTLNGGCEGATLCSSESSYCSLLHPVPGPTLGTSYKYSCFAVLRTSEHTLFLFPFSD